MDNYIGKANNQASQRLYADIAQWGCNTRYVIRNIDMTPMLYNLDFKLSDLDKGIFNYICDCYDNRNESGYKPLAYSYDDLAWLFNCHKNSIKESLKVLIKYNMIKTVGDRKGRSKTKYLPNINVIHQYLKNYLDNRNL